MKDQDPFQWDSLPLGIKIALSAVGVVITMLVVSAVLLLIVLVAAGIRAVW